MSDIAILIEMCLTNIEEERYAEKQKKIAAEASRNVPVKQIRNNDSDYYDHLLSKGFSHEDAYNMVVDRWYASQGY